MGAVQFSSCSWGKSEASISEARVFIHDIAWNDLLICGGGIGVCYPYGLI
jgi:hypothetical protein